MIHCKVVRELFYNEGNGYTVAVFKTEEELEEKVGRKLPNNEFTAVGIELPRSNGLEIDLEGNWKESRHGWQYEVSYFHVDLPTTKKGMEAYLSSNLIKGIGPVTAQLIVERFGMQTFHVLEQEPEKLLHIRGISEAKLNEILSGYHKSKSIRELMVYLSPMGVTPRKLAMIQEHFGDAAASIIKENPYRLCEIKGFGFISVDPIAMKSQNFQPDNHLRIKAAILYTLKEAERDGHLYLSSRDVVERASSLLNHKFKRNIVSIRAIKDAGNEMVYDDETLVAYGKGIFTKRSFEAEQEASMVLAKLLLQRDMNIVIEHLLDKVQKQERILLDEKQKDAVRMVFSYPVSIITGGPGRGKTTVIRIIIGIQEELDKNAMILLCAPTGKARRKMYESTGYPAITMHKAVGFTGEAGEEGWNSLEKLPDDLVIADEFSMVDMYLAQRFFACINAGTRLVLVGDKDQIESVGPGNVFQEMIESGVIPATVLDTCFRQKENGTIITNADRINANNTNLVFDDTFQFIPAANDKIAAENIRSIFKREWENCGKNMDAIQVLSPFRKDTMAGSDALNPLLQEIVNPKDKRRAEIKNGTVIYRTGDKVMQIKNDDEVSNGDIGVVTGIHKQSGKSQMKVDFGDDRIMQYEDDEFWPLTQAYAMSVHKAQGSEYPIVIIPMLQCFGRMLKRNILYTAVTRAKVKVILVGSKTAITQAIRTNNTAKRNTMFGIRLRKMVEMIHKKGTRRIA